MVTAVSPQEFRAFRQGQLPAAEEVAEGVWTLPLRNSPGHMPYTFAYLVQDAAGDMHIIDPGWNLEENLGIVEAALAKAGLRGRGPASIIVTHLHPDHMGMAERLRSRHGSPVVMHRLEHQAQQVFAERASEAGSVEADLDLWGVPTARRGQVRGYAAGMPRSVVPGDVLVDHNGLLPIPGQSIRVVHTPGHTPGHMCLFDEGRALLFTGDQLLPKVTPGVGATTTPHDNAMAQYLNSLAGLLDFEPCQSLPGHEFRYRGIAARARQIAARHLGRSGEVAVVLGREPQAVPWRVAEQLTWGRGWAALDRHYLVSALRQTSMHMAMVKSGAYAAAGKVWGHPVDGPKAGSAQAGAGPVPSG